MPDPYHHPADVLRFTASQQTCALVVVAAVTGGAMRAPGALMCVSSSGEVAGYVSNGCVDADIIYQARAAIKTGKTRRLQGYPAPLRRAYRFMGGSKST